jgi:hypothetical protein
LISTHTYDIKGSDWKFPIHTFSLGDIPNGRTNVIERFASKGHQAGSTWYQSKAGFDQSALARAIGTNNRNQLWLLRGVVINIPQNWLSVVSDRHGMN